jgi:calcineurin-like phosphoesterase family protein
MMTRNNPTTKEMRYYFTSDEHYGHENIIGYCNRPFKNAEEMDDGIIRRHNSVVGEKDVVFHAGDFTLRNKTEAENYIRRLTGKKHIFIKGSHDYWNKELPQILEEKIDGKHFVICHYAMRVWPRSHYGSFQFYGHSHGKLQPLLNQYDIGVDNNNFYPIALEDIMRKIGETKKLE